MDLYKNFDFKEITGTNPNGSKGLLTGYYEPAIKAYSYPKKDHILYISIQKKFLINLIIKFQEKL